ncbi:glycosyltransferase family 2 protein [Tessaracoccus lapidicaptus]|uniref:glycosyltransferase family 2 protein n=1 Tax=Tessaracoccus lapidicaptus TaxID=1427523 RepID=UPI0033418F64
MSDDCSPTPFPQTDGVLIVHRGTNGGFGAAVNSGAAMATGDLLLVLNSDLEIPEDFVPNLVAHAEPLQPAIVAPRVLDHTGQVAFSARRWPTTINQSVEWLTPLARWRDRPWLRRLLGHDARVITATTPVQVDWLVGAAFMVPLADFRAVGGLDERFFMNSEEIDLQRRLAAHGLPRIYLPAVSVTHEGGGSSDPAKRRRWLVTAQVRYAEKWGGARRLRVALTAATAANLIWNCVRALRGVDVAPLSTARDEIALIWRAS